SWRTSDGGLPKSPEPSEKGMATPDAKPGHRPGRPQIRPRRRGPDEQRAGDGGSNMAKQVYVGWHFLDEDRRLRWPLRDGEEPPVVEPGQTLRVGGTPVPCEWGLHASKQALDALRYAPGPIVCRVRLAGEVVEGDDKAASTERTVLWMADATRTLHEFGLWCAEQALQRERA